MYKISTPQHGVLTFSEQEAPPQQTRINGSALYTADINSAIIRYQQRKEEGFCLRYSSYDVKEDTSLLFTRTEPWIGFRMGMRKSIHYSYAGKETNLLQGQLDFGFCFEKENTLDLQKGNVYEVLDMYIEQEMLNTVAQADSTLSSFAQNVNQGIYTRLCNEPFWGNIKVLDTIDYFLKNPNDMQTAKEALRQIAESAANYRPATQYITEQHVENLYMVREEIRNNLMVHIPLEDLAKKAQMNVTYFKKMFFDVFELSPYQYLLYERLKKAKELLSNDHSLSFTRAAELAGFPSYDNFQRTFSAKEGKSLSEWRNANEVLCLLITWKLLTA